MAMNNVIKFNNLDQIHKFNPYVLLKRLSKEDIELYRNKLSSSINAYIGKIVIKQEREESENDYVYNIGTAENYKFTKVNSSCMVTEQEYNISNIKIEADDSTTIQKEKTLDTYKTTHTTNSNDIEHFPPQNSCDECYEVFSDSTQFIIHKNLKHKHKPYVCQICNERFILSAHLNVHLIEHVGNQRFINDSLASLPLEMQSQFKDNLVDNSKTNYCRSLVSTKNSKVKQKNVQRTILKKNVQKGSIESTQTNGGFKINLQNITKYKPFKCPNCTFESKSEAKFVVHNCNNVSENSFTTNIKPKHCQICFKKFRNCAALNGHMKYHSYRGEIISRKKRASTKIYKCKQCQRQFVSLKKLNNHNLQHKKQMVCNICNKQFFLQKRFEDHLGKHLSITTNKQNESNMSSNENDLLNKKQSNKKIIKCKFVPTIAIAKKKSVFIQQKNKLQCLQCKSYYKSRKTLCAHIRHFHIASKQIQSQSIKAKCDYCNILITKPNLYRHIKSLHPNAKPVKCLYCSMAFKDFPSRRLHISKYHKK